MVTIEIKKVNQPIADHSSQFVHLTDQTMEERKQALLRLMAERGLSALVIYADKEHGSNFEYLTGFIPRFEEGLQILNQDGSSTLILGNENYNKVRYSRTPSEGKKCSLFSLPNQPMQEVSELDNLLADTTIDTSQKVGLVGWKLIPAMTDQYDLPHFIVNALENRIGKENLVNATGLYIDPAYGARVTNNANEIAHYEYGSSLASDAVLDAMNQLSVGKSETEIGQLLTKEGQYQTVVTIAAFGQRFLNANLYPLDKPLKLSDKVALTVAYRGGLSSRSGYAVETNEQMESIDPAYLEEVVKPYFAAYHYWLTTIRIGQKGGDFFKQFNDFYPQSNYGWELCPGHLTANEEWLSSPFYPESKATVQSGMIFQVDFIPSQAGHNGVSAESTVAIADEELCHNIQEDYPELWERIQERRNYLKTELNIQLSEELLPLASTLAYYRPFFLNKDLALTIQ